MPLGTERGLWSPDDPGGAKVLPEKVLPIAQGSKMDESNDLE
jgi:hypothetical protein